MSDKRRFIQAVFIHYRPSREKFADALRYGEDAWDFLTENGYGAPETGAKPRESGTNHYAALTDAQRGRFDRYWSANDCKVGKQRAALIWARIDPDDAQTDWIVSSTRQENRRWKEDNPGHTRPYPELWLNERRWEDHPKPPPGATTAKSGAPVPQALSLAEQRRKARAEVDHWAGLYKVRPSDAAIKAQLDRATHALAQLDATSKP